MPTIPSGDKIVFTSADVELKERKSARINAQSQVYTMQDITDTVNAGGSGNAYTVYTAILNQTGTNAPVATILENNTGYTYTWARIQAGEYSITASGNAFDSTKTIVFVNCGNTGFSDPVPTWEVSSATEIIIGQPPLGDGKFVNGSFEIRIYS